jgi:tRNA-Thr(GGU) m(6)t(6)A37 methyltransferase TsaA
MMKAITYQPVGVIHSPFKEPVGVPIQPVFGEEIEGAVEIFPEFVEGLRDLEEFERVWLIYHLDRAPAPKLLAKPFLDDREHGIFAVRSPSRPNPIGLSCVRLKGIAGAVITIAGVDVIDGTPLLDIKPYVPRFDAFPESRAGWFDRASGGVTRADNRFTFQKGEKS